LAVLTWSVAIVIVIVCGVTWFTTTQDHLLPPIYSDPTHASRPGLLVINAFLLSALAVAVALLWARRRSVLDGWLMVMCCTWFLFNTMSGLIITDRFTVGWYGARGFEVIATMMVLFLLLSETTALYAKLARSVIRERRARDGQQFAMDATAAAIAHEIAQPLAAISIHGSAGLRWMARPDLDEARACIEHMISEAHRASDVIDGIRSLFKREIRGREWLDVNTVIRGVLTTVNDDLRAARISVSTELREQLPQLLASRAQLEEVLLNLIRNAIEAMHAVTDRARLLRITSFLHERSTVLITVEDNGTGIESKHAERVFDPFFTTKSEGTGIGLAVCRAIIDSHGGSLQASANSPYGTIFHVALPSGQS
jgi:signal transduction histidine kinase